jgi:hypothetical protein
MTRSSRDGFAFLPLVVLLAAGCGGSDGIAGTGSDTATDDASSDDGAGDSRASDAQDSKDAIPTDGDAADASGDGALADTGPTDAGPRKGPAPVLLGSAGNYVMLAKSAISTVPTSAITGDVGLSPAAASFVTGFSLTRVGTYWTAPQVVGRVYAADNDPPTPTLLTSAIDDMQAAYTDAAGRPTPDFLDLGVGAIGGRTLAPGLYKWASSVTLGSDVTVSGGANDTWIFQVTGDLLESPAVQVHLQGGARAKNIVWQVSGVVSLGTTAHFEGVVLCKTNISLRTGASINGRLQAQTAIEIDGSTVTQPSL